LYGHTGGDFAYTQLYAELGAICPIRSTVRAGFRDDEPIFRKRLTQDYFYSVNQYWLDTFHVDGFRFDDAPEYWDGSDGIGVCDLVFFDVSIL